MRRVGLVIGTVALLAAACGAFAQTTFTWQGSCGTQLWHDVCGAGTCQQGNQYYTLFQNNWGRTGCNSTPQFPGSGDTAIIPSGFTVRINGSVTVGRIVVQPGATLIWVSGNLNVGELVNEGTLEWANNSNNVSFAGTVVNRGTWRKTTPAPIAVRGTLRNEASGVLELLGSISRSSGTATLQNDGLIKKVSSNSATLYDLVITGTGRVQVQEGALSWNSCTLSNATVQVEQGTLYWNGSVTGNSRIGAGNGVVEVNGDVWFGDEATLTIAQGGHLRWTAGDVRLGGQNSRLVNEGLMEWAIAGQANLWYNYQINRGVLRVSMDGTVIRRYGVLVNEPSGVIELHRGRIVRDQDNIIQNDGLIKKVSSGNATLAEIVITGSGRVQVQEGMLQWNRCWLSNATVHVEQGTLYWNGSVTGNSRIGAGNGVVEVNGDVWFGDEATLTIAQGGHLRWTAGDVNLSGQNSRLVNEGLMEWAIAGQANLRYNYQINRGVLRVSMDGTVIRRYGVLVNEPSGVIELHRGRIVRDQDNIIQNDGLIEKVSSGNATLAGIIITGSGRVQVQEGMLQWNDCRLSNATVHVEQGTLYWNGAVAGNSRIGAGNGVVEVNGSVWLGDEATLTIAQGGHLRWTAGDVNLSGQNSRLVNEGLMEWAIAGQANLRYNYQINRGVLRVSMDGTVIRRYGVLVNEPSGVIELHRGRIVRDQDNIIQNDGLIKKVSPDPNDPTTFSIMDCPVTNRGRIEVVSGILNLTTLTQTDGETRIHRNAFLNLSNPLTLQGGKLTGAGQLNGAVANSTGNATFAAGIDDPDQSDLNPLGILTLNGNLTQNNDTVVEVELAGTDNSDPANPQYDQLVVIGASGRTVQLNGTLRVKGRNGFLPQAGDTFDILVRSGSSWSRTGAFHTVEIDPDTLPCVGFEVQYLADRVRLVAQTLGGPDVNRDGCVDDADLLAVLFAFGQTGGGLAEDVTCDEVVDDADLLGVLFNFGNGCG
jgi:Tfp pilus assembly protein PilP